MTAELFSNGAGSARLPRSSSVDKVDTWDFFLFLNAIKMRKKTSFHLVVTGYSKDETQLLRE